MDYYRPGEGIQMMVSCAQQDIKTIKRENESLRLKVEELEEKNRRLEEARENANAVCAKWEGLYRAELEKKAGKPAWIRVEDRLPELFCSVIVCRKDGKVEAGQKDVGDWWRVYGTRIKTVSYWMPLPEPPKEV